MELLLQEGKGRKAEPGFHVLLSQLLLLHLFSFLTFLNVISLVSLLDQLKRRIQFASVEILPSCKVHP